ncbi:ComEC family competence protein [Fibrisoma montanum]|uniref:ComEC family competence protein n=1 Tax=Fibrisoma montanum TaxID=2305895 RepID=A0A418MAN0_9BACT|nr:ComEC/Rec2 family competence protein [Fibrisoma montanum]RIV23400.1 ComEC family competence protein [Fibrisoma montanum]
MKGHPFVRYATGLIGGILLYVYGPHWSGIPLLLAGVGGTAYLVGFWRNRQRTVKPLQTAQGMGAWLLLLSLGWCITYQRTAANRPDNISHVADTLRAYEGVVVAQPEERAKTYRVELALRRGAWAGSWHPLSGRVIVYLDKLNESSTDSAGPGASTVSRPRYGEVWLVNGAPRPIDPPLNPGEFNYKRYLSYRNIYHQQYLRPYQRQILALAPSSRLTAWASAVNNWADSVFTHQIGAGARAEYGIVNAMILGVRDDLDMDLYRAYASAGAVHILSVSGMHVGILFAVLTFLLSFLLKRPKGKVLMAVLQLLILWFYALVTGLSPPVLRSAGMFTVLIIAGASGRSQLLANTLGASAFFILCYDPYALFSAGFQLSYLAVAGIGAWQTSLYQSLTTRGWLLDKLWQITAVALVAQLITFPLGVYYFHQFPTYFLLANPVVMLLSFLLLPLAMVILAVSWIPFVNTLVGWVLWAVAWLLNRAVEGVGQLPGAIWEGLWLSEETMVFVYAVILCGAALLLTRRRTYLWATWASAGCLAGLLLWDSYGQQHQRRLAVHFLPHRTAVSLTEGHGSTLLTDADMAGDPRSYEFYLKNTFGQWGVTNLTLASTRSDASPAVRAYRQTPDYALWVWHGKTILLVNRLSGRHQWRLPAVIDYLIIRRNALRDWNELTGRVVARTIIFDDSNKTPLTDKLLADAHRLGIACYSVRQMGAYVQELR